MMSRKSSAEVKFLDFPSFMQYEYGCNKSGNRKGSQGKTTSAVSKLSSSLRAEKKGWHDLPVLNLANVRRHLQERAELVGINPNGMGTGDKDAVLKSTGLNYSTSTRYNTLEGKEKDRKNPAAPGSLPEKTFKDSSVQGYGHGSSRCSEAGEAAILASPTAVIRSKTEFKTENLCSLNKNIQGKEKVLKHSPGALQASLGAHLPIPLGGFQTHRKQKGENTSKSGPLNCKVVTHSTTEINDGSAIGEQGDLDGVDINKLSLQLGRPPVMGGGSSGVGKHEWETKKFHSIHLNSFVPVASKHSNSTIVKTIANGYNGYNSTRIFTGMDKSHVEDKPRTKPKAGKQLHADAMVMDTCQRMGDDTTSENATLLEMNMPMKGMFPSGQMDTAKSKAPRLNLSTCQTCVHLEHAGFGGNPVENLQTCRTSRAVAFDASPRLVVTDRSISRKSSMSIPNQKQDKVEAPMFPFCSSGAPATPETVLRQCRSHMTEFEQHEIGPYIGIYFLGLDACKIQATMSPGSFNHGFDDERGDYIVIEHDHLAYRYEVLAILGKGSFGQVLKCMDHRQKALRAVKMIRNKRRFHQQALVEVKILEHLREKIPQPIFHISNLERIDYLVKVGKYTVQELLAHEIP